jgi:hypothetical protein
MFGTGPDGVEQGLGTSEFWLSTLAIAVDFAAPYFHWVSGIQPSTELAFAGLIASAYTFARTLRKRRATAPAAPATPSK